MEYLLPPRGVQHLPGVHKALPPRCLPLQERARKERARTEKIKFVILSTAAWPSISGTRGRYDQAFLGDGMAKQRPRDSYAHPPRRGVWF